MCWPPIVCRLDSDVGKPTSFKGALSQEGDEWTGWAASFGASSCRVWTSGLCLAFQRWKELDAFTLSTRCWGQGRWKCVCFSYLVWFIERMTAIWCTQQMGVCFRFRRKHSFQEAPSLVAMWVCHLSRWEGILHLWSPHIWHMVLQGWWSWLRDKDICTYECMFIWTY